MTQTLSALLLSLSTLLSSLGGGLQALNATPTNSQLAQVVSSNDISFTVGQYGLKTLAYKDLNLITSETVYAGQYPIIKNYHIVGMGWKNPDGTIRSEYYDDSKVTSRTLDADQQGFTLGYSWGSVHVKFSANGNTLSALHTVTNTSTTNIAGLSMLMLRNMVPSITPSNGFNTNESGSATGELPPLGSVVMGNYKMVIGMDHMQAPYSLYFGGWYSSYQTQAQLNNFPVAPSQSKQFTISYSFGLKDTPNSVLSSATYEKFAQNYPYILNWPDRRPIMMGMYADHGHQSVTNPRGWFNETNKDYVSEAGKAQFKIDLMAAADRTIGVLKDVNAQGIVLWDLEGEVFPHAITYIGEPRKLAELAPEMEPVADAFVKKIKDAGFKIGLTLRPQELKFSTVAPTGTCTRDDVTIKYNEPIDAATIWRKLAYICGSDGQWYQGGLPYFQPDPVDPAKVMIDKITYARNRWGATIFYVDSNAFSGKGPYPSEIFEKVLAAHPDVLILPELESARYFRGMAPYNELDLGWSHTPTWATDIYPQAFSVINVSDGMNDSNYNTLIESVKKGNILMGRGWFPDSGNSKIKSIYAAAGVYNPTSTPPPAPVAPSISSFSASPSSLTTGSSSTLSWSTSGATSISITPGNLSTVLSGSVTVTPEVTTTYTLTATNSVGSVTSQRIITVSPVEPPVVVDSTAPSIPTALTSSSVTTTGVTLSWSPSSDNVGVTGYNVFINGAQVTSVNSTSYTDSALSASTIYSYTVSAYDAAGNQSLQSTPLSVTTLSTPPPSTFSIGSRVKTTAKLKVRATPTTTGKALCTQNKNALGTITNGPVTANGYVWWQINYDALCDGWSVQDYLLKQ